MPCGGGRNNQDGEKQEAPEDTYLSPAHTSGTCGGNTLDDVKGNPKKHFIDGVEMDQGMMQMLAIMKTMTKDMARELLRCQDQHTPSTLMKMEDGYDIQVYLEEF